MGVVLDLVSRRILEKGNFQKQIQPTPTFPFNVVAFPFNVMAFPVYWAFPVTGRSLGLAAAPGHGQVALGANKVARGPHTGPPMEGEPVGAQGIPWEGTLGPHWEPFGCPRTNLEVFCDEVSFQEFQQS